MSLFLLLLVPVLVGLIGLWLGKGAVTWREFLIQEVVVVLLIVIAFFTAASFKSQDVEVWNGVITSKKRSTVSCKQSYSCNCHQSCSGSGSNRSCSNVCQTCWRYWTITNWHAQTSNGEIAYDVGGCYSDQPWEPKRYTEIEIGEPTAIGHSYTNYIKGNPDTIIKRVAVNKEFDIPDYPQVYDWYRANRFINIKNDLSGLTVYDKADNEELNKLNAKLGALKQVNIIVVVVNEADQMYVEKLREKWIGGKKNDFIVIIGTPNYPKIDWASVVSWSDSEDAKVFTKNRIIDLKEFDRSKVLQIIDEEVSGKYVRKEMKDFEYLKVRIQPSMTVQIIIFILGTISSIALTIYFKQEDVA